MSGALTDAVRTACGACVKTHIVRIHARDNESLREAGLDDVDLGVCNRPAV
jgi:Trk K+ transport system NAD-binding subunit